MVTAASASLRSWNLVLFGTSVDPLERSHSGRQEPVRKMKTRDHDPSEGDGLISSADRDSMARFGIILPHIEWMEEQNKPPVYEPPVYEPANKPEFEYIKPTVLTRKGGSANPLIVSSGNHLSSDADWSKIGEEDTGSTTGILLLASRTFPPAVVAFIIRCPCCSRSF